jgi:hypothetical protein
VGIEIAVARTRHKALKPATTPCTKPVRPAKGRGFRMSVSPCAIAVRRSDRHGNHWSCTNKSSIKRVLLVASIANMLFSSNIGNVYAAGPYDGEWNGSATAVKNGRCKSANVTLTVRGSEAIGQAKFDLDARNIAGTVRPDGTFGGTIGFLHLTGRFVEHNFEGAFQSFDCAWIMILKRSRPRTPASGPSPRHPRRASTLVA